MPGAQPTTLTMYAQPNHSRTKADHLSQKATASIERDENYVPHSRDDLKLPKEKSATKADYAEMLEETPIWTLGRLLIMQGLRVTSLYAIFRH